MEIDPKLVEQWNFEGFTSAKDSYSPLWYIAQRAADHALEEAAKVCDEMREHYSDYKDTALLNDDIALSNAASGEPRAAEYLACAIRAMKGTK